MQIDIERYLLDDLHLSVVELKDILIYLNNIYADIMPTEQPRLILIVNNGKSYVQYRLGDY